MKRFVQILAVIVVAAIIVFLAKWEYQSSKDKRVSGEQYSVVYTDVFDTVTQIVGYADSKEIFDENTEKLHECLLEYHRFYDIYHSYNGIVNMKDINELPANETIIVDEKIMELLKLSKQMYELTNGYVDITYGNLLSIWHEYRERGLLNEESAAIPSKEELLEAERHCGWNLVVLDEEASSITILDDELSFDVGSTAKGYAARMVAQFAKELGMNDFLISVGGNVIASGKKSSGKAWTIGIQNPEEADREEYLMAVGLQDGCLVTSGDYQRYYVVDKKRFCHIINPQTFYPPTYYRSVSILTKDSLMADALSTGLFCMPLEEGQKLIENLPDTEAAWILEDGKTVYSQGFEKYVVKN